MSVRVVVFDGASAMHKDCDTPEEAAAILHDALEMGISGWIEQPEAEPEPAHLAGEAAAS